MVRSVARHLTYQIGFTAMKAERVEPKRRLRAPGGEDEDPQDAVRCSCGGGGFRHRHSLNVSEFARRRLATPSGRLVHDVEVVE